MTPITIDKNIYVPLADGVKISVDVYRPAKSGKYPAPIALGSYGKELGAMTRWLPRQPRYKSLWDGCIETGDSDLIVSRGYVHIVADSRGSGYSEGNYGFHVQDMQDIKELIEWAAVQPWCDGNVGTLGISMFGLNSILAACMSPEPLKAAFLQEFITDPYRQGIYHGGILCLFFYGLYFGLGGDSGLALTAQARNELMRIPDEIKGKLKGIAEKNQDIRYYSNLYHLCYYPEKNPFFLGPLLYPTDGPYYRSWAPKDMLDNIKCPVYLVSCWENEQYTLGAFEAWDKIKKVPKKLMITPPGFLERPFHEYHDEMLRWYDYHFKGINNGIMDEPPMKLYITGINQWRQENEWPLARTKWTKLYLRSYNRLLTEPESLSELPPDGFVQQPVVLTSEISALRYRTLPMKADIEITGPIGLHFFAEIDSNETNWIIRLYDVDLSGRKTMLSRGYLKASHRALDTQQSKPYRPYHPHTSESLEVIQPGKIYEYDMELIPIGHVFKAGHQLELEIMNTELPYDPLYLESFPGGHHLPLSRTVSHKIYLDQNHPSHLYIPLIDSCPLFVSSEQAQDITCALK